MSSLDTDNSGLHTGSLQTTGLPPTTGLMSGELETNSLGDNFGLITGTLYTSSLESAGLETGHLYTGDLETGSLTTGELESGSLESGSLESGILTTGVLHTGRLGTADFSGTRFGPFDKATAVQHGANIKPAGAASRKKGEPANAGIEDIPNIDPDLAERLRDVGTWRHGMIDVEKLVRICAVASRAARVALPIRVAIYGSSIGSYQYSGYPSPDFVHYAVDYLKTVPSGATLWSVVQGNMNAATEHLADLKQLDGCFTPFGRRASDKSDRTRYRPGRVNLELMREFAGGLGWIYGGQPSSMLQTEELWFWESSTHWDYDNYWPHWGRRFRTVASSPDDRKSHPRTWTYDLFGARVEESRRVFMSKLQGVLESFQPYKPGTFAEWAGL